MSTYINVVRYHLVQRWIYLVMPMAVLAFAFGIVLTIFALTPAGPGGGHVGSVASIFCVLFVGGILTLSRSLPFGLALGITRRSYYFGTVLLGVTLAAVYSLAITGLQAIERATGGWGLSVYYFRVTYLLNGPWYLTLLTSFVGLTLLFVFGMWFGLVYRRWNVTGLVAFIAALVTLLLGGALLATWASAWASIGHFFTSLSASGLTGLLAALTAALLVGGLATMRRVTV